MNVVVDTIKHQFKNRFKINKIIDNIKFDIFDEKLFARPIGRDRILVYGNYKVLCCSTDPENTLLELITLSIQEIIPCQKLPDGLSENLQFRVTLENHPEIYAEPQHTVQSLLKTSASDGATEFTVAGNFFCELSHTIEAIEDIGGYDIILIASTRWDYIWQRPHHLAERLSKKNRVLFFNHSYPVSFAEIYDKILHPNNWAKGLTQIHENLWVFSTIHLSADQTHFAGCADSLAEYNYGVKKSALHFLHHYLQFDQPVIISSLAESIHYLDAIPRKMLCYDCVDDFSGFSWAEADVQDAEERLIQTADLVFTTAKELYQKVHRIHTKTFYIPNAVDFRHFKKAASIQEMPTELLEVKKPIIGFVGAFWEWVDEELVDYLSNIRPNWSFVIIGPVQPGIGNTITGRDNVFFLGIKDYQVLPIYMSHFDVCVIPFKLNKITKSANPIKMWEYLATGKPVVSTPIPEAKAIEKHIYIGETKEMFLRKIEEALCENIPEKISARVRLAEENDWNERVLRILYCINLYERGDIDESTICQ